MRSPHRTTKSSRGRLRLVGLKTPTDLSAKQTRARGATTRNVNLDRGCTVVHRKQRARALGKGSACHCRRPLRRSVVLRSKLKGPPDPGVSLQSFVFSSWRLQPPNAARGTSCRVGDCHCKGVFHSGTSRHRCRSKCRCRCVAQRCSLSACVPRRPGESAAQKRLRPANRRQTLMLLPSDLMIDE